MTVREVGALTLILDCYNSNPASAACAVRDLARREGRRRVAVLGDMLELGPAADDAHRALGELVVEEGIDLLCAVGRHAGELAAAAEGAGLARREIEWATDLEAAAAWLREWLEPGDVVLFKGSRGVRLEVVADAVAAWAAAQELEPALAD
jgi:UDP-N-acetylmuramyl pentapeptide synthase